MTKSNYLEMYMIMYNYEMLINELAYDNVLAYYIFAKIKI